MARIASFVAGVVLACGSIHAASAENGPALIVTYIEVAPAAKESAAAILKQLAAEGRNDPKNTRFDVLQRRDRPHFALLEAWQDTAAQDAHAAAAATKAAREKLGPLLVAPYDERPHGMLAAAPDQGRASGEPVLAVTHVDVIPTKKDEGVAALQQLVAAARTDAGMLRFEVLQQTSRPNHFTIVEAWRDDGAREAHVTAPHMKAFRATLLPMSGSLYDERLYTAVK